MAVLITILRSPWLQQPVLASCPLREQTFWSCPLRKDDFTHGARGEDRRLREAILKERETGLVPPTDRKMERHPLGEIVQNAEN